MNTADMLDMVKTQARKDWDGIYNVRTGRGPLLHDGQWWYEYHVRLHEPDGQLVCYLVGTEVSNMGQLRGWTCGKEFVLN